MLFELTEASDEVAASGIEILKYRFQAFFGARCAKHPMMGRTDAFVPFRLESRQRPIERRAANIENIGHVLAGFAFVGQ